MTHDPRVTLTTSRNFAKSVSGSVTTFRTDTTDIAEAVASEGYAGHWSDLEKRVLGFLGTGPESEIIITTEDLLERFRNAARAAVKREQVAAEEARQEATEQAAEQQQASAAKWEHRVLYPETQEPPATINHLGRTLTLDSRGKSFPISDAHPSLHGAHLLGYEGTLGSYAYYR